MAWSIQQGMRAADGEIEHFRSVIRARKFSTPVALNARTFRADTEGGQCIFRVLRRMSAETAARHANAFHRLARAVNAHRMSSPAAPIRMTRADSILPADAEIVATEHGPASYIDGDRIDGEVLHRIGGEDRHLGAFLSYIAHLADHGSERNLLFSTRPDDFPFWFVDLDFAFGDVMPWGFGRPLFYPGHRLNYQAGGRREQLPARAAELLAWIVGLRMGALARIFGLSLGEATDLHARCLRVRNVGLAAAIEAERFWLAEHGILGRVKGRVRARAEKYVLSCRALRHWLSSDQSTAPHP
jgi:hypothetical protein